MDTSYINSGKRYILGLSSMNFKLFHPYYIEQKQ